MMVAFTVLKGTKQNGRKNKRDLNKAEERTGDSSEV